MEGIKGNVSYGTLTTIIESDLKFGLIYVGSDDGLVHVSKDGGVSWVITFLHLYLMICGLAEFFLPSLNRVESIWH